MFMLPMVLMNRSNNALNLIGVVVSDIFCVFFYLCLVKFVMVIVIMMMMMIKYIFYTQCLKFKWSCLLNCCCGHASHVMYDCV